MTFDEDDDTAANLMPVFAGPLVRPGDVANHIDHYTILRTIEDMYQLAPLGTAATTPPVTGILEQHKQTAQASVARPAATPATNRTRVPPGVWVARS